MQSTLHALLRIIPVIYRNVLAFLRSFSGLRRVGPYNRVRMTWTPCMDQSALSCTSQTRQGWTTPFGQSEMQLGETQGLRR